MLKMLTTKNVGTVDRIIRALPIFIVPTLFFLGYLNLAWTIDLGFLAIMLLFTSVNATCGVYYSIGHSTIPKDKQSTTNS